MSSADMVSFGTPGTLDSALNGALLHPDDGEYGSVRKIHNGMVDHRPALIVRCRDAADVARAVNLARSKQMLVSVRGGGHGVAGHAVADSGLMIDLSMMKSVEVTPSTGVAKAQAGATWADFDQATQQFGLATTGGLERTTGIAGLTLAGGYGFLMRKYGLTCDNLVSADIVTADGSSVTASAEKNPDLFWGIRGGGGNFGIVTSFTYRLHALSSLFGGLVVYPIDGARNLIRLYDDFCASAPDELGSLLVLGTLPDGMKAVILLICFCGPEEEGRRCVEPLLQAGTPLMNNLGQMPYEAVQSIVEKFNPRGLRNYWRSSFLRQVSPGAAETMVEHFLKSPAPWTHVVLYTLGGAVARIPADSTAVENRDARHSFLIVGMWDQPADDENGIQWVRSLSDRMQPFSSGGYYVNFDSDSVPDRVQMAYGREKYTRLQSLKKRYDPENFFRLNQNIRPAD